MAQIRLLPSVMLSSLLLFGLKVGDVVDGMDAVFTGIPAAQAQDEAAGDAAATEEAANPNAPPQAVDLAAQELERRQNEANTAAAEEALGQRENSSGLASDAIGAVRSQSEVAVLQNLAKRREELNARSRELETREMLLIATENRVNARIGELKKIEKRIEELLKKHDDQEEEQLASLVKMYESMKPKSAARIFEQLDMEVLISVSERMKETKMAAILAAMDAASAKALTIELATRRALPETGG